MQMPSMMQPNQNSMQQSNLKQKQPINPGQQQNPPIQHPTSFQQVKSTTLTNNGYSNFANNQYRRS